MSSKIKLSAIESYIGENFLSYTAFCEQCGISLSTYKKIRDGCKVNKIILVKIARGMNVEISELLQ